MEGWPIYWLPWLMLPPAALPMGPTLIEPLEKFSQLKSHINKPSAPSSTAHLDFMQDNHIGFYPDERMTDNTATYPARLLLGFFYPESPPRCLVIHVATTSLFSTTEVYTFSPSPSCQPLFRQLCKRAWPLN